MDKAMGNPTSVLVMLFGLLFIGGVEYSFSSSIDSKINCIQSERKALVKFKQSLIDKSNRLSSWIGEDCCAWEGVSCNNRTGHVVKLDLHNPTLFNFDDSAYYYDYQAEHNDYEEYQTNYSKTCLGGEIDPSLLNLKHLHYLDVSCNNFSGIQIPEFLGSLKNLIYLNLSNAFFGGIVPHYFGNLTSLQYLDLGNNMFFENELRIGSLWWVSTLSSLKYLDLASVNLFNATDWLHAINMLPSLLELNLASCSISSLPPRSHVNFTSLISLDLSWNQIESLPLWFSNISGLMHLHLGGNNIGGSNPYVIGTFTSLTVLDFYENSFKTSMPNWFCKLKSLVHLDLGSNSFHGSLLPCLGNLTSLVFLDLGHNIFNGSISSTIKNLCNLRELDLSSNEFTGEISSFVESSSYCLQNSLNELNFSGNEFNGSIPSEMGNFSHLTVLDLSSNNLEGEIPSTMRILCNLHYLDLSYNKFRGEVPILLVKSPFGCPYISLKELHFGNNMFSGTIPDYFEGYKNLEFLSIHGNSISGSIPKSVGALLSLKMLIISNNQLNGTISPNIGQLSKLEVLDISNNTLVGVLSEHHFAKLVSLKVLHMSLNSLVLNVTSTWVPPFQLETINLASCKLGPRFPPWFQTQRHVEELNISNVGISDTIPDWFEDVYSRIIWLDISHNQISGKLPKFQKADAFGYRQLILKSNKFDGLLTSIPTGVHTLDLSNNFISGSISPLVDDRWIPSLYLVILSNNHLTGSIPTNLCNVTTMQVIDFSNNQLSGRLPRCLGDLQELAVLDLTNNSLSGDIPSSLGSLISLQSLHLHDNKFHGKLPLSLQNLTSLSMLDLAKNEFTDIIPSWIGENLSNVKFLSLRSNKFSGEIPEHLCRLSNLRLLNLAENNITGKIPHCFGNFTAMTLNYNGKGYSKCEVAAAPSYQPQEQEKIRDTIKGTELEYTSEIPFLTSMDLSNNHIAGNIPEELMDLSALLNLNLAGNNLEGNIPKKIGNLKQLLSLDLSGNKISGPIPQSLSVLNFLSHLNLSLNNLSGTIPTGSQLQTFDNQSYIGNNELCGAPLKSCSTDESAENHEHVGASNGEDGSELLWFYAGIGPGFLVGFLGFCAILHFQKTWRYAHFQFLENTYNRLSVAIMVKVAWLRRKFHERQS